MKTSNFRMETDVPLVGESKFLLIQKLNMLVSKGGATTSTSVEAAATPANAGVAPSHNP